MDDLLADFVAETREMLEILAGEMVAWEQDPGDRARLDAIFRFFHTVKGNCGFFDFPRLEALSHAAEDVLVDVRAGRRLADTALVDAVLAVIDRITLMIEAIDAGQALPEGGDEPLVAALRGQAVAEPLEPDLALAVRRPDGAPAGPGGSRSIRLPVDLLDRVMSGVSDMVLIRNELARRIQDLGGQTGLEATFGRLSMMLDEVRDAMTRTRMQRIETLFTAFPRLVRDLSADLGKQVMVDLQGADVELDREMIEIIRDPLVHIIRNAVDHGLETPAQRLAAGKREIGLVSISARQAGNQIRISISDDGRGIDGDRLVRKAIAAGLVTAEEAEAMSPAQRHGLICAPGLSTADTVTSLSGRGVGMDVVRANIERVGGTLQVFSRPGAETRIMLSLPLTLSIVPALTLAVRGQRFAVPRSYVEEIIQVPAEADALVRAGGRTMVTVRGQRIACADLGATLGLEPRPISPGAVLVVFRLMVGEPFALMVDQVLDHQELVIKPVAPAIMQTGLYLGTTLLDDGSPVLMMDVPGIAELAGVASLGEEATLRPAVQPDAQEERPGYPVLVFTGLDGRRRAMVMSVVNRIEKAERSAVQLDGAASRLVVDDRILPLLAAETGPLPDGPLEYFRLHDGRSELAYAIRAMVDIAAVDAAPVPVEGRADIAGIVLIAGEAVELVDVHRLFAVHGRAQRQERLPVCRLPGDDRWCQDFLRPMVEAAGYQVVDSDGQGEADIAIMPCGAEGPTASDLRAGRAIWLRDTPDAGETLADTIYRYDREALWQALRSAGGGQG